MGVMPGGYDYAFKVAAHDELLEHWTHGRLRVPVHERVGFERVPDAIAMLSQGGIMGKVAVTVGGDTERPIAPTS